MVETTTLAALKELFTGWNIVERAAKKEYPEATNTELFEICKKAMFTALKIKEVVQ